MKNKFNLSFLVITLLCCFGCGHSPKNQVAKVKLQKLTEDKLYDNELVNDVIFDAEELGIDSIKNKSRELFLKAIDLYKNKKTLYAAVRSFKASLLIFPDAKTYYELGNALLDINTKELLKEANQAYDVALSIQFQLKSNIYYKQACAYYLLSKFSTEKESGYLNSAFYDLQDAFRYGFTDTILLAKDWRLKGITNLPKYHELMINLKANQLTKMEGNSLFNLFKNAFPNGNNELVISKEDVEMEGYKESISYDFARFIPEMQNTNFGRDVSHDYFYVAKVKETELYTALVYNSISFWGEDMQPVNTTLAVYNNATGEIISRKPIACQCSAERVRTSAINNGEIVLEDYNRVWESPITEVSFEENKIKDYVLLSKATFTIDEFGKIIAQNVPQNFSDSNMVASNK